MRLPWWSDKNTISIGKREAEIKHVLFQSCPLRAKYDMLLTAVDLAGQNQPCLHHETYLATVLAMNSSLLIAVTVINTGRELEPNNAWWAGAYDITSKAHMHVYPSATQIHAQMHSNVCLQQEIRACGRCLSSCYEKPNILLLSLDRTRQSNFAKIIKMSRKSKADSRLSGRIYNIACVTIRQCHLSVKSNQERKAKIMLMQLTN